MENINKAEKYQDHLMNAQVYARNASAAWESAKELYFEIKNQAERLKNWTHIMSTAPVFALNFAFPFVCIAEYYFSKEIYRDINEEYPWAIAIGFIAMGVAISELLVSFIFKQKQEWKLFEEKRYDKETDARIPESELQKKVKSSTMQLFYLGIFLMIGILVLLYYFSELRVSKEIDADSRPAAEKFGIQDFMPIGLYFFEILAGSFVWYTIRRTIIYLQLNIKKNKLKQQKNTYSQMTENAKKKYQDAVEDGFIWYKHHESIDNEIHKAFYMSHERPDSNEELLFVEPAEIKHEITLKIVKGDTPYHCDINLLTEYKKHNSYGKNDKNTGEIKVSLESYPKDAITHIRLEGIDPNTNEIDKSVIKEEYQKHFELVEGGYYTIDWG